MDDALPDGPAVSAGREPLSQADSARASRRWWDAQARDYLDEHADLLGEQRLLWGPEGWTEEELRVLGDPAGLAGLDVLEVGAGGAAASRWLAAQGARVLATDLSGGMLRAGLDRLADTDAQQQESLRAVPLAQCDVMALPLADGSVDLVVTAYGAFPFVEDSAGAVAECARVLRPGGRLVLSLTHPIRWAFPDVPGRAGLTAAHSYFDRTPYVERDDRGLPVYVEHHRTLGDRVRDLTAAGLHLADLVEPPWRPGNDREWGGWSPLRGRLLPGTAILVARRPGPGADRPGHARP